MSKIKRRLLFLLAGMFALYLLLLIPDNEKPAVKSVASKAFAWNKDSLWNGLENNFKAAQKESKATADSNINMYFSAAENTFDKIHTTGIQATDAGFQLLLNHFFSLAALVAAQPEHRDSFIRLYSKIRREVKLQSQKWDINTVAVRNSLYQLFYGMRAAEEEVLLQTAAVPFNAVIDVTDEPSATPSASLFGIKVHSGDLLVSRGGAEVSALISRGNDYPANFSHVALIYIDERQQPFLIEAHIEKGVAVSSMEQYIHDKKLRCMILRPRQNLPSLQQSQQLPQVAAKSAYDDAQSRHIPYDFKMNFHDSSALFCSEVASYAYRKNGINLWQAISTISSPGVVNWLNEFGVENFVTQMPGDLEYDPQLSIVAEYRDPETLLKEHTDNAVMDALLEQADQGKKIGYNHWQLPLVRLVKGWCMIKNYFGKTGIIPEGMSATRALKNQYFVAMYQHLKTKTSDGIAQFKSANGYLPPYWQMIKIAGTAATEQ